MSIINGYDRKATACSPWISCYQSHDFDKFLSSSLFPTLQSIPTFVIYKIYQRDISLYKGLQNALERLRFY